MDHLMQDLERRGLARLMLRMPALRGPLQIMCGRDASAMSLCGAFEEAYATLERLMADPTWQGEDVLREYRTVCEEIESDLIERCLDFR